MAGNDDLNDNLFATGDSKSESISATGDGGNTGANNLPPGRIDPAIARASSGAGGTASDTGSAAPSGPAPSGEPAARPRGRPRLDGKPPGSPSERSSEKATARSVRASFFEKTLYSIHLGLASVASAPEFRLDKDDAKELGEAIAGVMKFYGVTMTPKQEAYALLLEAAAKVYPPMVVSYVVRKQIEAQKGKPVAPPQAPRPVQAAPPPAPTKMNGTAPNAQAAAPMAQAAQEAAPRGASLLPPGFDPFNIKIDDGTWGKKN